MKKIAVVLFFIVMLVAGLFLAQRAEAIKKPGTIVKNGTLTTENGALPCSPGGSQCAVSIPPPSSSR
ncbi:MAG TPA: hypothetical protein PLL34_03410 [Candidatus Mcinerneyibacteriales bacterium]|nr:hypothetical protein [Candidatus Mcinerneyibacteriales bacterium]HPQ90137.1 hypothetical protein [Candidatus Mcinerneyibacteriales bacterium]